MHTDIVNASIKIACARSEIKADNFPAKFSMAVTAADFEFSKAINGDRFAATRAKKPVLCGPKTVVAKKRLSSEDHRNNIWLSH